MLAGLEEQGVVAMEMESSGVAAACQDAGVPWTTFRVISDRPDDGLTDDAIMSLLRPDGSSDVGAALRLMVRHPGRVPGMVRLGRDSSMAASKAARERAGGARLETLTGLTSAWGPEGWHRDPSPKLVKCPGMLRLSGALGSVASGPRPPPHYRPLGVRLGPLDVPRARLVLCQLGHLLGVPAGPRRPRSSGRRRSRRQR